MLVSFARFKNVRFIYSGPHYPRLRNMSITFYTLPKKKKKEKKKVAPTLTHFYNSGYLNIVGFCFVFLGNSHLTVALRIDLQ